MTQDIPVSPAWYFNQRSPNFNQHFASDGDYIYILISENAFSFRSSVKRVAE